jgi:hypothetical protein
MVTLSNCQEEFQQFWELRPIGNRDFAMAKYVNARNESELPAEVFFQKYSEYIEYLNQFQNGKYTKKEFTIAEPSKWLEDRLYAHKIVKMQDPLEFYLYGI